MGFFSAMGRIITGKPVYTPQDVSGSRLEAPQPVPSAPTAPVEPKIIPQIHLGRVESHLQGGRLDIYGDMENPSTELVFIDKLALLGQHREVDRELKPGERHQVLLYSGAPLTATPQGYLELQYRKQIDGDYFKAFYQIRFERNQHGFEVTEFHQVGAVKDI
jgi:hypothetical protein